MKRADSWTGVKNSKLFHKRKQIIQLFSTFFGRFNSKQIITSQVSIWVSVQVRNFSVSTSYNISRQLRFQIHRVTSSVHWYFWPSKTSVTWDLQWSLLLCPVLLKLKPHTSIVKRQSYIIFRSLCDYNIPPSACVEQKSSILALNVLTNILTFCQCDILFKAKMFWYSFPWQLRMLNTFSSGFQPFKIFLLRILYSFLFSNFLIGIFVVLECSFLSLL